MIVPSKPERKKLQKIAAELLDLLWDRNEKRRTCLDPDEARAERRG